MKKYLKILQFLKGHRKLFAVSVVVMLVASFFEGIQLSMLVPMTDRIFNNTQIVVPNELPSFAANFVGWLNGLDRQTLFWWFPISVLILLFIKNVLAFWYQFLMCDLAQRITRDVRYQVFEKIHSLSLDYFSKKRTGELISRITNDVQLIEGAISYSLVDLVRQSFLIVIYIFMTFMIYPKAALLIFMIFPVIGIPLRNLGVHLRKLTRSSQEKFADIYSHLLETISGVRLVKAFGTEQYEGRRFFVRNNDYYKLQMKAVKRILAISPLTEVFGAICGITILFLIGKSVMRGELSFGIFILFFGSFMSIISPVKKIGNANVAVQKAMAANDRVYDVLDMQPTVVENPQAITLKEMQNVITLEHVNFQYDQESGIVLKDINLEIKKGDLVAIVGPTGAGKTTLVNLIPRFYDPIQGAVKIDGTNVRDVTFKSLRDQICLVTQEVILFNDTVGANIAYGRRDATQGEIEEAARKAFAHGFISEMPHKYDTVVGDRGFRLSGGEKQRIAIARAILRNSPILILDEATSQLDSESEKFVKEALDELMKGRTVIAIAHRLSTIQTADKIVVLQDGGIVGMGPHREILKTCPLYQKLYSMQFEIMDVV